MQIKEKLKIRSFEKYWKKQGRKNLFTWIHRYLRLHSELLTDSVYQNMYDYNRNTLIAYLKNNMNNKKLDDAKLGELLDISADLFNKDEAERVNKYKSLVDDLYLLCKENPNMTKEIHI